MDDWSPAAKDMLLLHLANTVAQISPADTIELWRVRKGTRDLRCIAKYLPTGIDLRLLEDNDFRRTQLRYAPRPLVLWCCREGSGELLVGDVIEAPSFRQRRQQYRRDDERVHEGALRPHTWWPRVRRSGS